MTDIEHLLTALLRRENIATLATVSEDGAPSVAPLFYIQGEDGSLYWLSSPGSRHSKNVERTGRAAISVHAPTPSWEEIQGAQLEGEVEVVESAEERERVLRDYLRRFAPGAFWEERIEKSRLYRFRPMWARYLDNSLGPGFRIEGRPGEEDAPS